MVKLVIYRSGPDARKYGDIALAGVLNVAMCATREKLLDFVEAFVAENRDTIAGQYVIVIDGDVYKA